MSYDSTIMPFQVNGKHRCPIVNAIFRCHGSSIARSSPGISPISHKCDPCFLICLQMGSHCLLTYSILMQCYCRFIIHSVHDHMGMTFSKHAVHLLLCRSFYHVFCHFSMSDIPTCLFTDTWKNPVSAHIFLPPGLSSHRCVSTPLSRHFWLSRTDFDRGIP